MDIENSNNPDSANAKDQNNNQKDRNVHQLFQVQNTPKGIFPMFHESSDPYIYDKKFYCDLPQVITPTKSFHYPFSIESFCQFDLLTMVFDLKKNCELLTDPKLNTLIHQDFINNSLELISPNLTQTTNNSNAKTEQLKRDILEIVERQEDVPNEKKSALHNRSFYLRNSTYFRTSLNVKTENNAQQGKRKNRALNDGAPRISTEEAKKTIAKTFNDIISIQVGKEHPHRPGVKAKNVYDVLPYTKLGGNEFCQFIFPTDPGEEAKVSEKFEKPSKFIIKKKPNETEDIYSLYQNEHLKDYDKSNEKNTAEYYSYNKDYTLTSAHQSVLFNRFLIFINREKKTAKFASISNKYTLKKFKRPIVHHNDDEEEEGDDYNNNLLKRKRERDIVVIPKEIEKSSLFKRNQWIQQNGFPFEFVGQDVQEIDYAEVEEIKKRNHINDLYVSEDDNKQGNAKKNDEEEEEDYFGREDDDEDSSFHNRQSNDDANSKSNYNNNGNENENENDNNEDNASPNANDNDNDNEGGSGRDDIKHQEQEDEEDALFSEKEEEINTNNNKRIDDDE